MSLLAHQGRQFDAVGSGGADPLVAVSHVIGATGSIVSAPVPDEAEAGHTLLFIPRVRGDRGIDPIPAGATELVNQRIGSAGTNTSKQRIYVFEKPYEGETNLSGSHSVSSAYGATLLVVRGTVVASTLQPVASNTQEVTHTKVGTGNGLIAMGLVIVGSGFSTADPTLPEWVQRGTDYYNDSNYFGVTYSRAHKGASVTACIGEGVVLGGSGNPNGVLILEIAP